MVASSHDLAKVSEENMVVRSPVGAWHVKSVSGRHSVTLSCPRIEEAQSGRELVLGFILANQWGAKQRP
jgi:hypothetical protein